MSKKVKIEKIEIKMGEKIVSLTVEEAQALKRELEVLFGKETTFIPAPYPVYPLRDVPTYPVDPCPWRGPNWSEFHFTNNNTPRISYEQGLSRIGLHKETANRLDCRSGTTGCRPATT